ncbi:Zinc finger MYM-type protein 1 [Merluccius polli]|uniref:Zinc finger MYM-type protein 1 n=1 Tax=Merluccius polli TaxID=89951 RepID=A0AA47NT15_MERPO|nr:Zinc finger MYM-type protein 1 [Merluccius polli]
MFAVNFSVRGSSRRSEEERAVGYWRDWLIDDDSGKKMRYLSNDLFQCHLPNKQLVSRDQLIYSPSTGMIYCFACKCLSFHQNAFTTGFCDWRYPERVSAHEKSSSHRDSVLALLRRTSNVGTVDAAQRHQRDDMAKYWREVLRRVVAVIKFLSVRGLAFRGDDELLGSSSNGNYLGLIELIAEFDPFLKDHLEKYGQKGKGTTSYLSSTVCDELICLMGEKVKRRIASELQQAKYFSIITDSTPDMSHTDQLTFIFRCVSDDAEIVERFVGFEPIYSHTGASLADCVVKMTTDLQLDLSNCRGQSYDNASNMSGKYNGLQAHLKKINPLIHYVPCAAHSLNLVGVNSIEGSCPAARNFFDLLQSLYVFCAKSTHRWNKMFHNTDVSRTLKPLSNTRWACRADSTTALRGNYRAIREALGRFSIDPDEKEDARREATGLCAHLDKLETAILTTVWDSILSRFKTTTESLQRHDITLDTAKRLLESLRSYLHRHGLQCTFPNVFVALRIFLTLPVTNAEGERSFSQLKRVKNELRMTMTQKRLTALSLLTIESELVKELDFDDVVDTFACGDAVLVVEDTENRVTLNQLLMFVTGGGGGGGQSSSPGIPRRANSNTCALILKLPLHTTYESFSDSMISGIIQSPCFGYA